MKRKILFSVALSMLLLSSTILLVIVSLIITPNTESIILSMLSLIKNSILLSFILFSVGIILLLCLDDSKQLNSVS